jgi:hypothetical protein
LIYYDKNGIRVRSAVLEDVDALKDNLSQADVEEIRISNGLSPEEALRTSIEISQFKAVVENGRPIAVFGVYVPDLMTKEGAIWLLSTDDLEKISIRFAKQSRAFIDLLLVEIYCLYNFVYSKNHKALKLIRYLGAEIEEAVPYGRNGEYFNKFYFRR